jgi:hypothetical protein
MLLRYRWKRVVNTDVETCHAVSKRRKSWLMPLPELCFPSRTGRARVARTAVIFTNSDPDGQRAGFPFSGPSRERARLPRRVQPQAAAGISSEIRAAALSPSRDDSRLGKPLVFPVSGNATYQELFGYLPDQIHHRRPAQPDDNRPGEFNVPMLRNYGRVPNLLVPSLVGKGGRPAAMGVSTGTADPINSTTVLQLMPP